MECAAGGCLCKQGEGQKRKEKGREGKRRKEKGREGRRREEAVTHEWRETDCDRASTEESYSGDKKLLLVET
eukprot:6035563-Pleurochrysis_carterae.AAC.3